jgi:hypothetical protein
MVDLYIITLDIIISASTFAKTVKYDTNGWLGLIGGPLESLKSTTKAIKDKASKANKDQNNFKTILLTYPNVAESPSKSNASNTPSPSEGHREPLTGTIDEVSDDPKRIKEMGVDHIIFSYNFIPIGRDIDKMIHMTKQLSRPVR